MRGQVPEWMRRGWLPAGRGKISCPKCGSIVSSNAMARISHKCNAIIHWVNGGEIACGVNSRIVSRDIRRATCVNCCKVYEEIIKREKERAYGETG